MTVSDRSTPGCDRVWPYHPRVWPCLTVPPECVILPPKMINKYHFPKSHDSVMINNYIYLHLYTLQHLYRCLKHARNHLFGISCTYLGMTIWESWWQYHNLGGPKLILTRRKNLGSAILDVQAPKVITKNAEDNRYACRQEKYSEVWGLNVAGDEVGWRSNWRHPAVKTATSCWIFDFKSQWPVWKRSNTSWGMALKA